MDKVSFCGHTFVKYISKEEIDKATEQVARQIMQDYNDEAPLVLVTLNGAIFFAVELMQKLQMNLKMTSVKLSSYSGMQSTNEIHSLIGINEDVTGRRILIIEDIVDTGQTYIYLHKLLMEKGAKDVRIASMTMKKDAYKGELPVHYVGIDIPNKFVIGHGLDVDGYGRNLLDIYQIDN